MFLNATWHEERYGECFWHFWTKKNTVSGLLNVKLQSDKYCWCSYKLNCNKRAAVSYLQANNKERTA